MSLFRSGRSRWSRQAGDAIYLFISLVLFAVYRWISAQGCAQFPVDGLACVSPYRLFFAEDGAFENAQFLLLLVGAGISTFRLKAASSTGARLGWATLALVFAFVAMEEISWGQRLFDWQFEWVQNQNRQNEINLHNLLPLYGNTLPYRILGILGVLGGLGVLVIPLARRQIGWSTGAALLIASAMAFALYVSADPRRDAYLFEYSEVWIYLTGVWFLWRWPAGDFSFHVAKPKVSAHIRDHGKTQDRGHRRKSSERIHLPQNCPKSH